MEHIRRSTRLVTSTIKTALMTALFFTSVSMEATASIETMGEAINIAGRQRMLSQRIAQSYFLAGIKPESTRGQTQLNRAALEFERNLHDLKDYPPAKSLRGDIAAVHALWIPYKTLVSAPVNKINAEVVLAQSNAILKKAHFYVTQLEKVSGTSKAEIINISGRQRMLSQRIAKNFLAAYWEVNGTLSTEALYEDLAEYENVLTYLSESELNTPEISTQLNKVKGQFAYASKGFDGVMSLSGARLIHVVTGTTDSMLRGMNIVTGQYAQLLKD